jgi:hypothetical protein
VKVIENRLKILRLYEKEEKMRKNLEKKGKYGKINICIKALKASWEDTSKDQEIILIF